MTGHHRSGRWRWIGFVAALILLGCAVRCCIARRMSGGANGCCCRGWRERRAAANAANAMGGVATPLHHIAPTPYTPGVAAAAQPVPINVQVIDMNRSAPAIEPSGQPMYYNPSEAVSSSRVPVVVVQSTAYQPLS